MTRFTEVLKKGTIVASMWAPRMLVTASEDTLIAWVPCGAQGDVWVEFARRAGGKTLFPDPWCLHYSASVWMHRVAWGTP